MMNEDGGVVRGGEEPQGSDGKRKTEAPEPGALEIRDREEGSHTTGKMRMRASNRRNGEQALPASSQRRRVGPDCGSTPAIVRDSEEVRNRTGKPNSLICSRR